MKNKNWKSKKFKYAIKVLLSEKSFDKSITKACEELSELSVKLLQYVNKRESIYEGDIEEEIADCEQNLYLLKHYFPVSEEIRKAKIKKFLKSDDYKRYLKSYKKNYIKDELS